MPFGTLCIAKTFCSIKKKKMKYQLIIIFLLLISNIASSQDWKNYKGELLIEEKEQKIELKILFLNEGIIIGSYRELKSPKQFKLVGNLKDDSLKLVVRLSSNDELRGFLIGKLKKKRFCGTFLNSKEEAIGNFKLKQVYKESYTDLLKTHRNLYEHTTFEEALSNPKKVKSIDVARKQLENIPDIFSQFKNLVSINLLGNRIDTFPIELTKTNKLKELSLSSNGLEVVGKEIGELTELRILIMNFNKIEVIPKEIGNLTELLYLDLGDNQISQFPDEIGNLKKLQEFHVDDNLLSEMGKEKLKELLPNCVIHFGK